MTPHDWAACDSINVFILMYRVVLVSCKSACVTFMGLRCKVRKEKLDVTTNKFAPRQRWDLISGCGSYER